MTVRARVDVDVVFQDATATTLTIGTLSDHVSTSPLAAVALTATCTTAAVAITGPATLSTLVIKNTGAGPLRVAGGLDVTADRVAVLPTTATVTVAAVAGTGSYSCVWVG
jgi:hypothetical protein